MYKQDQKGNIIIVWLKIKNKLLPKYQWIFKSHVYSKQVFFSAVFGVDFIRSINSSVYRFLQSTWQTGRGTSKKNF